MKTIFIAVAVCLLCACAARAQMGGPPLGAAPSTGTGFGTPPTSPNGATLLACDVPAGGVAVNSFCLPSIKIGRTNTIATDTIDCVTDRGLGVLETFNGAVNVTVPQTGAGNCTGGFGFFIIASNKTGNVTTPTLNLAVGQISSGGQQPASSLLLNPGQVAYVYTDSSGVNYLAAVIGGITGLTSGYVPQATSTSGLTNSPCDHITNAGAQTCQDAQIAPVYKTGSDPSSGIVKGTSAFYSGDEGTPPTGMPAASDTIQPSSANGCMESIHGAATDKGCIVSSGRIAAVTIGSGADIAATQLCSTTNCPAGTYRVNVYIDMTTPCGTSGTFIPWIGYTDDNGARTGSSVTTFFPLNGIGSAPAAGTLTTTTATNYGQATYILRTTGAATGGLGSINYGATRTACGSAGPMVGKMYLTVEAL